MYEPITTRHADALISLALGAQAEAQARDSARATVAVTIPIETYLGADSAASVDLPVSVTIAADTARRLACDGHLETVLVDGAGAAVGIGRRSRQVPAWLARQVHRRDRGCRFPGCGLDRPALLQRHHIVWCDNGGRTDLDNLIDVCFFNHHLLHEGGWHAHGKANHDIRWRKPDGTLYVPGPHQLPPELQGKAG